MVSVTNGKLTGVTAGAPGDPLTGKLKHGHTVWMSRKTLHTATRYTVRATAVDADGPHGHRDQQLPHAGADPGREHHHLRGRPRQTYGVGMPIMLTFDHPVTNRRRSSGRCSVRTSKPVVGAWYWDGDSTVYFRPRNYWPAHTTVHFEGDLDGVEAAPGVYGDAHAEADVHDRPLADRGRQHGRRTTCRSTVDKKLYGDWPISTGKPGDDTPNGTYLTIEKGNPEEMKGPGYDI